MWVYLSTFDGKNTFRFFIGQSGDLYERHEGKGPKSTFGGISYEEFIKKAEKEDIVFRFSQSVEEAKELEKELEDLFLSFCCSENDKPVEDVYT